MPNDNTDDPTDATNTPPAQDPPAQADPPADDDGGKAGRDAARYRTQLRERETELTTEREAHAQFQRTVLESLAASVGVNGESLWKLGVTPEEFLADGFDRTAITEAIKDRATELGLSTKNRPSAPDVGQGRRGGGTGSPSSWREVVNPGNVRGSR